MKITMHHSFFKLIAKFFLMNLFISHAPAETTNFKTIQCEEKTLTKGWEILANNKIFFGHQS
ncbi:MAG: hypothetical protein OQK77_04955, partial [Psychromonas sp.]|nr:hypothetical protein [Psychromonas sp.]